LQLLYRSNRTGLINLYIRDLQTGKDTPVFTDERLWRAHGGTQNAAPNDWSEDGRYLIYTAPGITGFDLFRMSPASNALPQALARSAFNEMHGAISPGSQRLAFSSDESGRFEIYLQSFPEGKGKQLVSLTGGTEPRWRSDGRELYFLDPAGKIMAVGINPRGDVTKPKELFSVSTPAPHAYRQNYDTSPDGQWFVVNRVVADQAHANVTVMINWLELSKRFRSSL
jgi:Tol biopolymer transport system component